MLPEAAVQTSDKVVLVAVLYNSWHYYKEAKYKSYHYYY
jgi:hypothetical protein